MRPHAESLFQAAGMDELIVAEYLRDADTPEKVRDVFTEILGDLFLVFPTIAVANYHRSKSVGAESQCRGHGAVFLPKWRIVG